MIRRALIFAMAACTAGGTASVQAGPVDTLREFVLNVRSGQGRFTQTVTAPDGKRRKVSQGVFEFQRPNRFRFVYAKPFEQTIVADGQKVWLYDPELNQVSVRRLSQALGATPAALLAGTSLDQDFELAAQPAHDGLEWTQATPRQRDGTIQTIRVGFRGKELAALEILDHFGQRSVLQFPDFKANAAVLPEQFRFTPPPGADLIEQ
ncbi:MAG: outer membrane lipoprotein chaperone LolA [Betaproteobacteria bacterium]|jgi:outer membrane lipoprotein carrier protein